MGLLLTLSYEPYKRVRVDEQVPSINHVMKITPVLELQHDTT
jgi:hypothetical protein